MAKVLYMHIGMPKCASTSIQSMLKMHAKFFAQHGKFYGRAPSDKTKNQGNAASLLADLQVRNASRARDTAEFFFNRDSDVILSNEMLISLGRGNMADDLIGYAVKHGFEIRLICYLRRQDHWIESDYKQHIMGGSNWTDGISTLLERRYRTKVLDYNWMLENWARIVPREHITVVPIYPGQGEVNPIERFLEFLGIDPSLASILAPPRQNISPPASLIEPMRHLKIKLMANGVSINRIKRILASVAATLPSHIQIPERRFILSKAVRKSILEKWAASNEVLSSNYLNNEPAFDGLLEEDSPDLMPLDREAVSILAAWIAYVLPEDPTHIGKALEQIRPKQALQRNNWIRYTLWPF